MSKSNLTYEQITVRNIGVLSREQQEIIRKSTILIAGAGLGSIIARLAVQTGFGHIIIADGDKVEESNINRQIYSYSDVDQAKAIVTAKYLRQINPYIKITCLPHYLDNSNCMDYVLNADIIIDTIDMSALKDILALHSLSREYKKLVLFPLNLGMASGLFVFDENSDSLEQLLDIPNIQALPHITFEQIMSKWSTLIENNLKTKNNYLIKLFNTFIDEVKQKGWCPTPQIGVATYLTASLTIAAIIKTLSGKRLKGAPTMHFVDVYDALLEVENQS